MSWSESDKKGFLENSEINIGQINLNSVLGQYIYQYANNNNYSSYLEIGTWNGLGSTKCFVEGFKNRNNKNFKFYSLECNDDKHNFAKNIYKNEENIYILNNVLINKIPDNIYEIFPDLLVNDEYKYWNEIDFDNMKKKSLFFESNDIPHFFDVIFLDGGEFTTWYEYNIIKNKCNVLILDDIHTNKCKKIVEDIKSNDKWRIIIESNDRNGFLICENIN
jgi:hypothetical protein